MIDRILMELYDEYSNNNLNSLQDFVKRTLPQDGTDKLFIGCILILFAEAGGYKARYDVTREKLYEIVLSAKEKINDDNLLLLYVDKINTKKGIKKYFNSINKDEINKYADLILEYLDQFKPSFIFRVKNIISQKANK